MYHLHIDFYDNISVGESSHHVLHRHVVFKLVKKTPGVEWPRLLKEKAKPAWLKVDFDKYKVPVTW